MGEHQSPREPAPQPPTVVATGDQGCDSEMKSNAICLPLSGFRFRAAYLIAYLSITSAVSRLDLNVAFIDHVPNFTIKRSRKILTFLLMWWFY
jgi:hypothetical protein